MRQGFAISGSRIGRAPGLRLRVPASPDPWPIIAPGRGDKLRGPPFVAADMDPLARAQPDKLPYPSCHRAAPGSSQVRRSGGKRDGANRQRSSGGGSTSWCVLSWGSRCREPRCRYPDDADGQRPRSEAVRHAPPKSHPDSRQPHPLTPQITSTRKQASWHHQASAYIRVLHTPPKSHPPTPPLLKNTSPGFPTLPPSPNTQPSNKKRKSQMRLLLE